TADAAVDNPFQYTGRENDGTGLYYYRARYYAPALGRFISSDPIGLDGGGNTYAYANENPLMYTDSLGLMGWADMPAIPQSIVNIAAGFGDGVSLGITDLIREGMGTNDAVDFDSGAYMGGIAGGVAVSAIGIKYGPELSIGNDFRIAPWGNRTGNPYGKLPHYHRRAPPSAGGETPPGQGIGRHRPWEPKSPDKKWCDRF
ncbi:RHS repeat-associated core domain-containing protein, partial [Rugamonas sp. CCM 8940]